MSRKEKNKNITNYGWIVTITLLAFFISLMFSLLCELILPNTGIIIGVVLVLVFILLGILFDIIGVAVATSNETPFHSMSSQKVKGAKTAVLLKRNADKVSSFCNDVIGDICGIISGSAGAGIALTLSKSFNIPSLPITLIITALIAAMTIGGKAMGKGLAMSKSNDILFMFAKSIAFIRHEK